MSVSILLITHEKIGPALLEALCSILGDLPLTVKTLSIPLSDSIKSMLPQAKKLCDEIDKGDGVLVLTDLYGASPDNLADKLYCKDTLHIISGLNLPMLIKVINYHNLPLHELSEKARIGGVDGIVQHTR